MRRNRDAYFIFLHTDPLPNPVLPMTIEKLYDTAKLIGYNQFDDIVYSERLSLYEYYDGEHIWDSSEGILKLRMVKMVGKLYDPFGKVCQEFESEYCPETGHCIGGRTTFEDGTTRTHGTLEGE